MGAFGRVPTLSEDTLTLDNVESKSLSERHGQVDWFELLFEYSVLL